MQKRVVVVFVITIVLISILAVTNIHLPYFQQVGSGAAMSSSMEDDQNIIFLPLVSLNPWPDLCYAPGTQNYQPPTVEIPEIILQHGTTITVTTANDTIDGDTSSVPGLISNPGADGMISLWEAISATNNDPGEYTINFSPGLSGTTIYTGDSSDGDLPALTGGGVIINGDIDGDSAPDITIADRRNIEGIRAFIIQSSNITLHALKLTGYYQAIMISPITDNTTYSGITISNMEISDSHTAITLEAGQFPNTRSTHNRWEDFVIVNNDLDVINSAIDLRLDSTIGDVLDHVIVANNMIQVTQDIYGDTHGDGIHFTAGTWDGSIDNSITNVTVSQNTIQGNGRNSIVFVSGGGGASSNRIEGVLIYDNQIQIFDADWARQAGRIGINLITGDGATDYADPDYPLVSSNDNIIRNVEIVGNSVEGFVGGGIEISGADGTGNSYNTIENVTIIDNFIKATLKDGDYHNSGINIEGGSGKPGVLSTGNRVSNFIVQQNTIHHSALTDLNDFYIADGSIMIVGASGFGAEQNYVQDIWISLNEIDSVIPSVSLTGSSGFDARWNEINGAKIYCNTITKSPMYPIWDPPLKGIVLIGGLHDSEFNRVEADLYHNDVVGLTNDLSAIPNGDEASYGNVVDYQIIP